MVIVSETAGTVIDAFILENNEVIVAVFNLENILSVVWKDTMLMFTRPCFWSQLSKFPDLHTHGQNISQAAQIFHKETVIFQTAVTLHKEPDDNWTEFLALFMRQSEKLVSLSTYWSQWGIMLTSIIQLSAAPIQKPSPATMTSEDKTTLIPHLISA